MTLRRTSLISLMLSVCLGQQPLLIPNIISEAYADTGTTSQTASTGSLVAPSDNKHAPYMGVYKGGVNGLTNIPGIKNADAYASWLNRKIMWAEDNQSPSWDNVEGAGGWQLPPWSVWVNAVPGRRFIFGVNIIPGPWDGSGPSIGPAAHIPVSLEKGASGSYNIYYKKLAENLVKYHLNNSILRLGIEFDGGWFPWRVVTSKKAVAFAEYFRQIVTTMRAVPGAEKLQFVWNPGLKVWSPYDVEMAWPGDKYVDYIGLDFYDDSYAKDTYPIPANSTPEKTAAIYKKTWDSYLNGQFGLLDWKRFAQKHHTPLSFPEWGLDNKPDHHGGGDNPYFIEQMYQFINNPANNVAWHSYFDYQAGDGHHQLSPNADGKIITEFPKASARFRALFSLP